MEYAEDPDDLTGTVYAYVPAFVVRRMIEAHGGLLEGEIPRWCPKLSYKNHLTARDRRVTL